jgi:integrase
MSLTKTATGFTGLFRRKGMKPLHLSMRTTKRAEARERHDAVQRVVREGRSELIEQVRAGVVSVERVTAMVRNQEPLLPVVAAESIDAPAASQAAAWDTVADVGALYLQWLKDHPNRSDATRNNAEFQLARWCAFAYNGLAIGDTPFDRVPSAAVQAYQRSMLDAKTPPNSVTVYMARVSALWTWAIEQEPRRAREEQRTERPIFSPVIPELLFRGKERRDRVLSIDEIEHLFEATPESLLFPVACGVLAGLRAGEMLHLRPVLDVDVELGTLMVRDKPGWNPKTRRSHRLVPMAPELHQIARVHIERYASPQWMLPSPAIEGEPITDLGFRPHFKAIVERAGLEYGREKQSGVTFHTLRHTFASHAVMAGVDLYTVAKLLGDSVKTVEDTYADLSPDHKRLAVAKLSGALHLKNLSELLQLDTPSDTETGAES